MKHMLYLSAETTLSLFKPLVFVGFANSPSLSWPYYVVVETLKLGYTVNGSITSLVESIYCFLSILG